LAFRVSGLYQQRDDFVDNLFTGEDDSLEGFEEYAARIQALWTPKPGTDILLNLHARENDGSARLFRANIIEQGSRGLAPGFDFETVNFNGLNFLEQSASGVTLKVDHELNDAMDVTYVYGRETSNVASRGDIDGGVPGVSPTLMAASPASARVSSRSIQKALARLINWCRARTKSGSPMIMAARSAGRPACSHLTKNCT